ncbi:MAG: hypothetical protein N2572_10290, partial [Syntrophales bacterium]|nr:hypothetical protein [Syntrophales bacterium]
MREDASEFKRRIVGLTAGAALLATTSCATIQRDYTFNGVPLSKNQYASTEQTKTDAGQVA